MSSILARRSVRRIIAFTSLAAGLVALCVALVPTGRDATAQNAAPPAVSVTVAVVETRATSLWDEYSGRLEAVERVEIRPRVAGAILSAAFAEGALVRAGDLLFKIDPAPYEAEVARAEAQLEAAKARVVYTQGEVERSQQLVGKNVLTLREHEQRENAYREAVANVKGAEATLQTARLNLGYTQVRAPVNGRVGKIEVTAGNLVAAGPSSPVLTTLVSAHPMYASFDASEDAVLRSLRAISDSGSDRGRLDRISVILATGDGTEAKGHVQFVDNQVNGQSGTMRVRAVFDNADGRLIPGQFARLRMGQPTKSPLLLVEERAIGTDQDKRFVLVVDDERRTAYRAVTLGGSVEGLRVVTTGLNAGERIVINGLQRVRPGMTVNVEVARMGGTGS